MKISMALLFILTLCTFASMDADTNSVQKKVHNDFRSCNWGASVEDIKTLEKSEFIPSHSSDEALIYLTSVANIRTYVGYVLFKGQLCKGNYLFSVEHSNLNDYIEDYISVKEILVKKYGKPKESRTVWRDNTFKSDSQHWGVAVSSGHLYFYSEWETTTTDIVLSLRGDNFKITFATEYYSKELIDEARAYKKSKDADNF